MNFTYIREKLAFINGNNVIFTVAIADLFQCSCSNGFHGLSKRVSVRMSQLRQDSKALMLEVDSSLPVMSGDRVTCVAVVLTELNAEALASCDLVALHPSE